MYVQRLLVVCLFSYSPTSVLSQGKQTHNNFGIDKKGLGEIHETSCLIPISSETNLVASCVPNIRPISKSRGKRTASSLVYSSNSRFDENVKCSH